MIETYSLKHMFSGEIDEDGKKRTVFFTKDNEHLLGNLSEKVRKDAVAKGWITVTEVPTVSEAKADQREAAKAEKGDKPERIRKEK